MRPWYSQDGNEIFFHTAIGGRNRIVRYDRDRQTIAPLENDTVGYTHGSFTLRSESAVLAHSTRGGRWGLWKFPLDGSTPQEIAINEFQMKAHATMSLDGILIFDSLQDIDTE
jgi:hypothetical protein